MNIVGVKFVRKGHRTPDAFPSLTARLFGRIPGLVMITIKRVRSKQTIEFESISRDHTMVNDTSAILSPGQHTHHIHIRT